MKKLLALIPTAGKIPDDILQEVGLIPIRNAIKKFDLTGTAKIVVGKNFGIVVKDEGDYISVRFGSNDLTPIGSVPSGEKNFATKEEAFGFARQIQDELKNQLSHKALIE